MGQEDNITSENIAHIVLEEVKGYLKLYSTLLKKHSVESLDYYLHVFKQRYKFCRLLAGDSSEEEKLQRLRNHFLRKIISIDAKRLNVIDTNIYDNQNLEIITTYKNAFRANDDTLREAIYILRQDLQLPIKQYETLIYRQN